ncbi:endonuclease/exonuclease/phosphatase family protein [Glycomyces algeriensis]|uniref:Endonuclease n=1 Tax=Glycomyces algeriensis TaxID=256037 RepID=A0A9W6LGW2_9ACTN|nr:endonuclease/exonuclease/phosphatase family protein [Glycomyces algeriensis]MDA1365034.1 endonuclease/exonuclease/phosphatase family protein [Glycomyces algeriensis]MDR7349905.1 endonuclease/exonuclease/phosphatase family metal-dependent hydrolase [Glycomyces algeriensis]GLI42615.1 endonuclease [Glycomyces algeriensis]
MTILSRRNVLGAGLAVGASAVASGALAGTAQAEEAYGGALIGAPRGDRLHLITFNLRYEGGDPSPRTWDERRPLVKALLEKERPTVLFTQEGLYAQNQDVLEDLKDHDWIHLGRLGGSKSEATAVFWDRRRLKALEYDHLWLSDTPLLIGSRSWGNNVVRMLTWVRFQDLRTGKDFYVVNNHFDHQSEDSRQQGAQMNLDVISAWTSPVIVAGDFNNTPDTPIHQIFTDGGLVDTMLAAEEPVTPVYGTWNGWNPVPTEEERRIDWILTTPEVRILKAGVNTYTRDGRTPSDHWPAQALIELP